MPNKRWNPVDELGIMPAAPKRKGGAGPGKKPFVKATGSKANGAKSHPKKGSSGATSKGNWKGKAKAGDEDEVEEAGSGLESDLEAVSDNEDVGEVDEGADQVHCTILMQKHINVTNIQYEADQINVQPLQRG